LAAMRRRISQGRYHFQKLEDRSRPAMRQHQRKRIVVTGTNMQEVNGEAVQIGLELRQRIQARLRFPPIILPRPVIANLLHVIKRNPLRPIAHRLRIGQRVARSRRLKSSNSASLTAILKGRISSLICGCQASVYRAG
jgi:hypothetical protein